MNGYVPSIFLYLSTQRIHRWQLNKTDRNILRFTAITHLKIIKIVRVLKYCTLFHLHITICILALTYMWLMFLGSFRT